jgi:cytochrome c biogenesis protein CcdA
MWLVGLLVAFPLCAVGQFFSNTEFSLEHEVFVEADRVAAGESIRAVLRIRMDEGWHVNANKPLDQFSIATEVSFPESELYSLGKAVYPEAKTMSFSFSPGVPVAVYEHEFLIGFEINVAEGVSGRPLSIPANLRYQACNDKQCLLPANLVFQIPFDVAAEGGGGARQHAEIIDAVAWSTEEDSGTTVVDVTELPVAGPTVGDGDWATLANQFKVIGKTGFLNKEDFLAFLGSVESGDSSATEENRFAGMNWWLIVGAVLGGGLLLNLTPCVLPLIPINIAIIGAGVKSGSRMRGFSLGGVYGVGISLVYGLLGLVVVLGISTAFGAINSTVWFNVGIAILFVVLGLAMFDLITIDFTRFQAKLGLRGNEQGSFVIAFVMGCVSALLAGACVAPVVIYTIVYAQDQYSQGVKVALLLPFFLGIGMAAPWPFLGAGLSVMPKPGMWMVRVKQGFSDFILGFAAYYGYLGYGLMGSNDAMSDGLTLEAGLAQGQAEGKPVLIDFWATWCKNCYVMDEVVFQDEEVIARLEDYVMVKYQAEDPEASPARDVLEKYGVVGLPAIVILDPES